MKHLYAERHDPIMLSRNQSPDVPMPRRIFPLVLMLFVMMLAGCSNEPTGDAELRKGTVERGSIDVTVSTTGTILPEEQVNLTFDQPGLVDEVLVEAGDAVQPGDVLARLTSRRQESAVRQAEIALEIQQLNYDRLFSPPSNAELAAAQAGLEATYANYNKIASGADPEDVWIGELQVEQAYKQYEQAEASLKAVQPWLPEDQLVSYREQRDQALLLVETRRLQLEQLQSGAGPGALQAAQASITQAQAGLNGLLEDPSELEVARLETQISQAELALRRAQEAADGAGLRAPFAGVIAQVNVQPGSVVPGQGAAFVLVDGSRLHVVASIDEIDVADVMPGQPALVSPNAAPDAVVPGQVTDVSPAGTIDQGIVTYEARIDLAANDAPLLAGMTVTVDIITQRLADVLLVPNWALSINRETGQTYVSVLQDDGTLRDVPIALGVRGEAYTQVISGVEEGQTVAVSFARQDLINEFTGDSNP